MEILPRFKSTKKATETPKPVFKPKFAVTPNFKQAPIAPSFPKRPTFGAVEIIEPDGKAKQDADTETRNRRYSRPFVMASEQDMNYYIYKIQDHLGAGQFGSVYKAFNVLSKSTVAIKSVARENEYLREPEILTYLSERNVPGVLPLQKIVVTEEKLWMEFPLAQSLPKFVASKSETFMGRLNVVLQISVDLCESLMKIHEFNVIHRDIKPDNILIWNEKAHFIDFGFCKRTYQYSEKQNYEVVTPLYRAPEIIGYDSYGKAKLDESKLYYSHAIDLWSLGVVIYEILTDCLPFDKNENPSGSGPSPLSLNFVPKKEDAALIDNLGQLKLVKFNMQKNIEYWETWLNTKSKDNVGNILFSGRERLKKLYGKSWTDSEKSKLQQIEHIIFALLQPNPKFRSFALDMLNKIAPTRFPPAAYKKTQPIVQKEILYLSSEEMAIWREFVECTVIAQKQDPKVVLFSALLWHTYAPLEHQSVLKQNGKYYNRTKLELFSAFKIALRFYVYDDGVRLFGQKYYSEDPEYQQEPEKFNDACSLLENAYVAKSKTQVYKYHPFYESLQSLKGEQAKSILLDLFSYK